MSFLFLKSFSFFLCVLILSYIVSCLRLLSLSPLSSFRRFDSQFTTGGEGTTNCIFLKREREKEMGASLLLSLMTLVYFVVLSHSPPLVILLYPTWIIKIYTSSGNSYMYIHCFLVENVFRRLKRIPMKLKIYLFLWTH